ncbi:BEN domain-containing protein 2-like isoform X2 [Scyliorhinus torazame]|uniref:BEN domain-containing protein 2-like isoform X2 n=1 Tax=Scyliorhinus torazame TaxID=75743 RepID=UPI003B59D6F9
MSLPQTVVKTEEEVETLIFDGAEVVDIHNVGIPQGPLSLNDICSTSQVCDEQRRCLATLVYLKNTRSNDPGECGTAEINLSDVEAESTGYQEQPLSDSRHAGIITHQLQSGKRKTFAPSNSQLGRPVNYKEVRLKKRRLNTMVRPAAVKALSDDEDYEEYYDEESDAMPDYDSDITDSSGHEGQQSSLMEILNYCQVIYSTIRRLDKKTEVIQRQVSDLRQGRTKFFAKQRQVLASLSNGYNQKLKRKMGLKSAVKARKKRIDCSSLTDQRFLGNPKRNVKIPGAFILKASQKTQPKLAARYLARNLFTDEVLVTSSVVGSKQQGLKSLDPNKLAAVREFLSKQFPQHDLTEIGKDWKACISSINSMISVTRRRAGREYLSDEKASAATVSPSTSDSAINGQLWWLYQNSAPISSTQQQKPYEKLECLGRADRKVELPASVIHLAKQRTRPELAARFLIRHLFPDSILLRSNVYGAIRKGKAPLDCNKINAVREFLADCFPGFDLTEDGKDWKVCVDAINGVIRCLRYELKKTPQGRSFLKHYSSPYKTQSELE